MGPACWFSSISQLSVTAHDVAAFLPMQMSGSATAHPTPALAMPARASIWSTRPCGMLRLSNSGARLGRGPLLFPCEGAVGGERRSSSSEVQSILSLMFGRGCVGESVSVEVVIVSTSAASCRAGRRTRRPPGPAGLTAAGLPSTPRRSPASRRPRASPPGGRAFAPPCVAAGAFAEEA